MSEQDNGKDLRTKKAVIEGFIKERWGGRASAATYEYIASYIDGEVQLDGKSILDIGCGNGLQLAAIAVFFRPRLAVGVDNYHGEGSPKSDRDFVARLSASIGSDNLFYIVGDALDLPFKPGSFDMIYISHCLHHVYESRVPVRAAEPASVRLLLKLIEIAYRLLNDEGVLVVAEVPRYNLLRALRPFGFLKSTEFETKQEPSEWIYALRQCGFQRFTLKFHTPYPLRLFRSFLSSRIGRYIVSGQYYIFAYKN